MGHTVIRKPKPASAGWDVPVTWSLVLIAAVSLLGSCNNEKPTDLLLAAEREAPVGWVRVRLFRDSTFELSLDRGSWKRGTFKMARDTFLFEYLGETDSLRQRAMVVENELRFIGGGGERVDFAEITFRE